MTTNNVINFIKPIPACASVNNANQLDVSGDGSVYPIQYANDVFDNSDNFDGVSTFTAPRTGNFMFYFSYDISGAAANRQDEEIYMIADGVRYDLVKRDCSTGILVGANEIIDSVSVLCPMTVGSTAITYLKASGGAKLVSVPGATTITSRVPYFSCVYITGL